MLITFLFGLFSLLWIGGFVTFCMILLFSINDNATDTEKEVGGLALILSLVGFIGDVTVLFHVLTN